MLPLTLAVAFAVLLLDQLTKWIMVARFEGQPAVDVIGELLRFNVVRNPGAAFSLGSGFTIIFSFVALAVAAVIVKTASTLVSPAWAVALGGLLGGALGNLMDRIFREPSIFSGHVVDFIQLPNFAIFNVADIAVTCSAVLMGILAIKGVPLTAPKKEAPAVMADS